MKKAGRCVLHSLTVEILGRLLQKQYFILENQWHNGAITRKTAVQIRNFTSNDCIVLEKEL